MALPVCFECRTFEHSIASPTFADGSFMVRHPKELCLCVEFVRAHVHARAQILFQFLFWFVHFSSLSFRSCVLRVYMFLKAQFCTRWTNIIRIANGIDERNDDGAARYNGFLLCVFMCYIILVLHQIIYFFTMILVLWLGLAWLGLVRLASRFTVSVLLMTFMFPAYQIYNVALPITCSCDSVCTVLKDFSPLFLFNINRKLVWLKSKIISIRFFMAKYSCLFSVQNSSF